MTNYAPLDVLAEASLSQDPVSSFDVLVNPPLAYTRRDEVITSLMDQVKCPITLDTSDTMIIFNDQLYDSDAFEQHRLHEQSQNQRRLDSGYDSSYCRLKDPRTNRNFRYDHAISNLYFDSMTDERICQMINTRNPSVTILEAREFIPVNHTIISSNDFVTHVNRLAHGSSDRRTAYITAMERRRATAASNLPVQNPSEVEVPNSDDDDDILFVPPVFQRPPVIAPVVSPVVAPVARPIARPIARNLPVLPSFVQTAAGQSLAVSLLSIAKADGYENALVHRKRIIWFKDKLPQFFATGGLLAGYRLCNDVQLRRKFKEAEADAKLLYNSRSHQSDQTGIRDEGDAPLYKMAFFDYFDYLESRRTNQNATRAANRRVVRSLIGQQAALSNSQDGVHLLPTVAPANREIGSGDIAGVVNVEQIDAPTTPRRRQRDTEVEHSNTRPRRSIAPNDGRAGRTVRHNIDLAMNDNAFLPPSTRNGGAGAINVDRMEAGYNFIAQSISNLARQQAV